MDTTSVYPPQELQFFRRIWYEASKAAFGTYTMLDRLESTWVDQSVNMARWKEYMEGMLENLAQCTLFATVMLAVDMSFLVVPGVGSESGKENGPTLCIYISIIFFFGTVISAVQLSGYARRWRLLSSEEVRDFMTKLSRSRMGSLVWIAFNYCIPHATLLYGTVMFLMGFCARVVEGAALYGRGLCVVALILILPAVFGPLLFMDWVVETMVWRRTQRGIRLDKKRASMRDQVEEARTETV